MYTFLMERLNVDGVPISKYLEEYRAHDQEVHVDMDAVP